MMGVCLRSRWLHWLLLACLFVSPLRATEISPDLSAEALREGIRAGKLLRVGDQVELTLLDGSVREVRITGLDRDFITIYYQNENIPIDEVVAMRDLNQDAYKFWTAAGATAGVVVVAATLVVVVLAITLLSGLRLA